MLRGSHFQKIYVYMYVCMRSIRHNHPGAKGLLWAIQWFILRYIVRISTNKIMIHISAIWPSPTTYTVYHSIQFQDCEMWCKYKTKTNMWCVSDVMAQCMLRPLTEISSWGHDCLVSSHVVHGEVIKVWYLISLIRTNGWPGGPVLYVLCMCACLARSGWLGS